MIFFSFTGLLACPFLLLLNSINLNPLWMDWILDLNQLKVVCLFSGGMCLTFGISISLSLLGVSATSSIQAESFLPRGRSLLFRASVYKLSFLLIDFIKENMASTLAIGKPFVLYRILPKTVQCVVTCHILHVERCLVISQVVSYTFKLCLHFIPVMLKDILLLMSIILLRVNSIILPGRTRPLSLVDIIAYSTV